MRAVGRTRSRQPLADRNSSRNAGPRVDMDDPAKPKLSEVDPNKTGIPALDKQFKILKRLGEGSYGVVAAAQERDSRKKVAIKKISGSLDDEHSAKQLLRELKLLRHFSGHENVVNILVQYNHCLEQTSLMRILTTQDVITSPPCSGSNFKHLFIITDLMDTDLHRIIRSSQPLSVNHIRFFTYQIIRAMKFLHSANVIHRDLKPSNILVNANCDLKVCDLGLARVEESGDLSKSLYVVTRWYRAPELLLGNAKYSGAIDMWSVGCILAEMLGRTPLFPGKDYVAMLRMVVSVCGLPTKEDHAEIGGKAAKFLAGLPATKRVKWHLKYPSACPQALSLLDLLLQMNPEKRISAAEAIRHPFLLELHDPDDEPDASPCRGFDFDSKSLSTSRLRQMIADEAEEYRDKTPHQGGLSRIV